MVSIKLLKENEDCIFIMINCTRVLINENKKGHTLICMAPPEYILLTISNQK